MEKVRYPKIIYLTILLLSVLWCGGVILAPVLAGGHYNYISDFLYSFYEKSCHQLEDRSLTIGGYALGVCSRCTAIYFGFMIGVVIYPFFKPLRNTELPSLWIIITAAGLVFLDVITDVTGIHKNTFVTREITGAVLGLVLPFYIIPGTVLVFHEYFNLPDKSASRGV